LKEKNHGKFLKAYEPIHHRLSGYCRALSGNREDARDLLQDTVLNVMQNMEKIKDMAAFKTYVFRVAGNLHKMKMRRKKFRAGFNEEEIKSFLSTSGDQEALTDLKIIYETIQKLPPKTAETLFLFHVSDLPLEEIRNIQGGSLSGVKLRLKRGREKLLTWLNTPEKSTIIMALFLI